MCNILKLKVSETNSVQLQLKTCVKQPLSKRPQIGFQDQLSPNAGQKYCRMLQESNLQYFCSSLSYHLSLSKLFCLFLEWPFYTGFTVLYKAFFGFQMNELCYK